MSVPYWGAFLCLRMLLTVMLLTVTVPYPIDSISYSWIYECVSGYCQLAVKGTLKAAPNSELIEELTGHPLLDLTVYIIPTDSKRNRTGQGIGDSKGRNAEYVPNTQALPPKNVVECPGPHPCCLDNPVHLVGVDDLARYSAVRKAYGSLG
jgi:hypothetical protein